MPDSAPCSYDDIDATWSSAPQNGPASDGLGFFFLFFLPYLVAYCYAEARQLQPGIFRSRKEWDQAQRILKKAWPQLRPVFVELAKNPDHPAIRAEDRWSSETPAREREAVGLAPMEGLSVDVREDICARLGYATGPPPTAIRPYRRTTPSVAYLSGILDDGPHITASEYAAETSDGEGV